MIVFGMPKMRVRLCSFLGVILVLSLVSACMNPPTAGDGDDGKPLVLTTFTVTADIVANVGGDHIRVESIVKPGVDVHGYEPTPQDIAKATRAQLIFDNGLNLEAWFEKFLTQTDAPRVVLTRGIDPIGNSSGDSGVKPNPHAWMSPSNAHVYVDNTVVALSELLPDYRADFESHAERYKAEISGVHEQLLGDLGTIPELQRALVTCEGAFSYLARDAGLTEKFIWPVNAEQQATPQRVASVIEFVSERNVPAVFCESTVSGKAMKQIAAETGAEFAGILYVDSLSSPGGPVPSYLDLLKHDAQMITAGLTGGNQ